MKPLHGHGAPFWGASGVVGGKVRASGVGNGEVRVKVRVKVSSTLTEDRRIGLYSV